MKGVNDAKSEQAYPGRCRSDGTHGVVTRVGDDGQVAICIEGVGAPVTLAAERAIKTGSGKS